MSFCNERGMVGEPLSQCFGLIMATTPAFHHTNLRLRGPELTEGVIPLVRLCVL